MVMVPSTISVHINSATDNVGACYTYVACNDKASEHPHCASACTLVHQVADDRLSAAHHGSYLLTTLVGCLSVVALVRLMASDSAAARYQNDSDTRSIKARSACGRVAQYVLPRRSTAAQCLLVYLHGPSFAEQSNSEAVDTLRHCPATLWCP